MKTILRSQLPGGRASVGAGWPDSESSLHNGKSSKEVCFLNFLQGNVHSLVGDNPFHLHVFLSLKFTPAFLATTCQFFYLHINSLILCKHLVLFMCRGRENWPSGHFRMSKTNESGYGRVGLCTCFKGVLKVKDVFCPPTHLCTTSLIYTQPVCPAPQSTYRLAN